MNAQVTMVMRLPQDSLMVEVCPFCNSRSRLVATTTGRYYVECMDEYGDCFVPKTPPMTDSAVAMRWWNVRLRHK